MRGAGRADDRWARHQVIGLKGGLPRADPPPPRCGRQSGVPGGMIINNNDGPDQSTCSPAACVVPGVDAGQGAGGGTAAPPGSPTPVLEEGGSRAPRPLGMREPGEAGPPARGRLSTPGPALPLTDSMSGPETPPPPPGQTRWRHPNTCWAGPEKVAPGETPIPTRLSSPPSFSSSHPPRASLPEPPTPPSHT